MSVKNPGNIREITLKTDRFSVAGGMWTTTQQTWHPADIDSIRLSASL